MHTTKRKVKLGFAALGAALALTIVTTFAADVPKSERKPNIVVILADDLGYADISANGGKEIPTPNIDSLARNGVRFTSGYVSGPYCSPTRAALLTGRYQQRYGHEFNPAGPAGTNSAEIGLSLKEVTLADRLKAAGYKTGLVGKWHLGDAEKFNPVNRGFQEYFGFLGGAHSYTNLAPRGFNPIQRGLTPVEEREYLTDAFTREAKAFIDRHQQEPFFLYLAYNAVHSPLDVHPKYIKRFAHITDPKRRRFATLLAALDDGVGEVREKLRATGLEENTLVVFFSDNGGPTGNNTSRNDPLRGFKATTWEGGVRVPFIISWKGHLPAGKVDDRPIIQLDLHPTALALAGVDVKPEWKLDGVNLLPYLTGAKTEAPHDALYWRFGQQIAIRQGDWKLVKGATPGQRGGLAGSGPASTEGAGLYNLAQDISEANDLAEEKPEKFKELDAAWDAWNAELVPPTWGAGGPQRRNSTNSVAGPNPNTSPNAEDVGVRIRFGLNDKTPTNWDGTVTVTPGRVALISGWRFAGPDVVDGTSGWKAATRSVAGPRRSNNPQRAGQNAGTNQVPADNGVLLTFTGVTEDSVVQVKTVQGDFSFKFAAVPFGKIAEELDGGVEVERTAATLPLTNSKADDDYPSAAVAADGTVFVSYTSFTPGLDRDERARRWEKAPEDLSFLAKPAGADHLWLRAAQGPRVGEPIAVTPPGRDIYKSAVAVDGSGRVWVSEFDANGKPGEARAVVNSPDYEARPALTYNADGSLWIAWEQSGPTWGKDWGAYAKDKGIGLYRDRQIGLAVLKDGQWLQPAPGFEDALPGAVPRRRQNNVRVPAVEAGGESRQAGQKAEARRNCPHNNIARLVADSSGRVWLIARSRQNDQRSPIGSVWFNWAAYYDGQSWVGPILVPHSDNLLYNIPAVVALNEGGLLVAHSSDHRQDRHLKRVGPGGNAALDSEGDPFINDVYLSRLQVPGSIASVALKPTPQTPEVNPEPSPATRAELAAVARVRNYRVKVDGQQLLPLRGEFHRHTEISGDGGNDGALEDAWRYAVDVAAMDWLGIGDHDNGNGREYTWWLTQKTTDAFYLPGSFASIYSYERSVQYPEGHRNVIFARRGVRTLPRLPITDRDFGGHAPDTQLLFKYLHLFRGVCASHTSATRMGTDWRDNDPEVEPLVEIYQGCRQNYERPGAPRAPTENDSIGGWEPKGFVNLALKKGYRLGFQSSSDHGSTHISYAIIYAKDNTREEIVKAIKQRHAYAATDNILADVRGIADGKEHFLGDEFTAGEPPQLRVKLTGTGAFSKVVIVKDDEEVHTVTPDSAEVQFAWTDPAPTPGKTSYYYVRGEQKDGELVWVSPQWITYQPKQ